MARSNEWDDDDDDAGDASNLVKDLRKQLREALKAKDELTEQVGSLSKATRTQSLKDVFASKQLNPKLAVFYPGDGEATPEAVDSWVKEYADVFGLQVSEQSAPSGQTNIDADSVTAFQRLNAVQGDNPQLQLAKAADMEAKIRTAGTQEELMALLAQL